MQVVNAESSISVTHDGLQLDGQPDQIANLLWTIKAILRQQKTCLATGLLRLLIRCFKQVEQIDQRLLQ